MYEEFLCSGIGFAFAGLSNYTSRRPLFSRVYIYPLAAAVGFGAGRVLSDFNERRIVERELAIWDYVHRHPEDFPEISPKKYKDLLDPWVPIR
jgi:hypothetical protein